MITFSSLFSHLVTLRVMNFFPLVDDDWGMSWMCVCDVMWATEHPIQSKAGKRREREKREERRVNFFLSSVRIRRSVNLWSLSQERTSFFSFCLASAGSFLHPWLWLTTARAASYSLCLALRQSLYCMPQRRAELRVNRAAAMLSQPRGAKKELSARQNAASSLFCLVPPSFTHTHTHTHIHPVV